MANNNDVITNQMLLDRMYANKQEVLDEIHRVEKRLTNKIDGGINSVKTYVDVRFDKIDYQFDRLYINRGKDLARLEAVEDAIAA